MTDVPHNMNRASLAEIVIEKLKRLKKATIEQIAEGMCFGCKTISKLMIELVREGRVGVEKVRHHKLGNYKYYYYVVE